MSFNIYLLKKLLRADPWEGAIDKNQLTKTYESLLKKFHPDKCTKEDDKEDHKVITQAIVKAYGLLKRNIYLLDEETKEIISKALDKIDQMEGVHSDEGKYKFPDPVFDINNDEYDSDEEYEAYRQQYGNISYDQHMTIDHKDWGRAVKFRLNIKNGINYSWHILEDIEFVPIYSHMLKKYLEKPDRKHPRRAAGLEKKNKKIRKMLKLLRRKKDNKH